MANKNVKKSLKHVEELTDDFGEPINAGPSRELIASDGTQCVPWSPDEVLMIKKLPRTRPDYTKLMKGC